jgi:hypothetical protein
LFTDGLKYLVKYLGNDLKTRQSEYSECPNTVGIRKPDRPAFKWSSLGRFLCPTFEWLKQDGRFRLDRYIYI